jgi:hypothetical protein
MGKDDVPGLNVSGRDEYGLDVYGFEASVAAGGDSSHVVAP